MGTALFRKTITMRATINTTITIGIFAMNGIDRLAAGALGCV